MKRFWQADVVILSIRAINSVNQTKIEPMTHKTLELTATIPLFYLGMRPAESDAFWTSVVITSSPQQGLMHYT